MAFPNEIPAIKTGELMITSGMSMNKFLDRRLDSNGQEIKVFQKYKSFAPFTQIRYAGSWAESIKSDFKLSTSYDLDKYATNTLNNGAETDIAHATVIDLKYCLLYKPEPKKDLLIGVGVGAGNFGLHTDTLPFDYAINYIHAYLPFVRVQNTYQLAGYKAQWELEVSRSDSYFFQGYGYDFTHHLWLYQTPQQEQGFFISLSYWDILIPMLIIQPNVTDSHTSFKCGWEVNFH